jgi:RNA polymerase sigma-70 factor (ECF subfamily)
MKTTTDDTDEIIAGRVQSGDSDSFGVLIERYEAKLKRYARKFLSYQEDIEDLVQDVFIKAYTNIQSYDSKQRFSPWIYRIAHNTFVNELKRKDRGSFIFFDADTVLPQMAAKETTDGVVLDAELKEELDSLLSDVSPKYREALVLHYLEELSYQEISEILHIPVTTVGVRMSRGRTKLRACFDAKQAARKQNIV